MNRSLPLVGLIALGSLLVTACGGSSPSRRQFRQRRTGPDRASTARGNTHALRYFHQYPCRSDQTTRKRRLVNVKPDPDTVIVQGRVYDAGHGQRLNNATIEWQFLALDWQQYNGQLQVPADGLYRLLLPVRSEDEVIITAYAPGYLPSMARLLGRQLSQYGSRLNFGLVTTDGPAPTLPGALGTIQLRGIVYNSARGLKDPIANARVTIVNRSVVQPEAQFDATTSISGTFLIPVALHTTDHIEVTIAASGYQTATLSKSAQELAWKPQFSIALKPAPKQ